jgi:hypothetical protein
MPHQGEPFAQRVRAVQHPIHPPGFQPFRLECAVCQEGSGSLNAFCYALGARRTGQEAGDAGLWSIGQVTLELAPVSGEASTAVQVNNPA